MVVRIVFALIVLIGLFIFRGINPSVQVTTIYVLFFFFNVMFDFFNRLGKNVPIKQLTLVIAIVQWGVAPFLSYHFYTESEFYFMQIDEEQYMSFIFPSIIFLFFGLFLPIFGKHSVNLAKAINFFKENKEVMISRGKLLFVIGLASQLIHPFVPKVLAFALFLLGKLIFIGAFYLYASKVRFRYIYLLAAFLPVIISAAQQSIFHDMFLWGGFLFIIYALIDRIGTLKKLFVFSLALFVFFFVQLIKNDYRESIQLEQINKDRSDLLKEVAADKLNADIDDEYFQGLVDRLNQGWIIARIMYVVPTYEPYAEGETITEAIKSAFVPRFLMPDKIVSGGYYFSRFTGIDLQDTSMNLGLVGEAYANYGLSGGVFFMFLFGLFVNAVLSIVFYYARKTPEIVLWIPFLFLYMIKAEDDFATMINQFTKALYIMIGLFVVLRKLYPYLSASTPKNLSS